MSTTAELKDFVYEILDLDAADLPTSLVYKYLKDGFQRVINLERRWPFLETTYALSTIASQRDYAISAIGNGDMREIVSIVDTTTSGNRLSVISLDEAENVWHGSFDTPSRPLFFAEWSETIKLYPKPDTAYALTVRGYRKPSYSPFVTTTLEVDCDERLHLAIAYYAISQAYKRQEDNEMASIYKQSFEEAVSLARKDMMRASGHRPMIMSRGNARPSEHYWLQSLGRTLGQ